jgi:hypothetical protein
MPGLRGRGDQSIDGRCRIHYGESMVVQCAAGIIRTRRATTMPPSPVYGTIVSGRSTNRA